MPQNPNDALWDPRPRLVGEAERVDEGGPADSGFVLVELAPGPGMSPVAALAVGRSLERPGFSLDEHFGATPLGDDPEHQTFVVRGRISDETVIRDLESDPRVVKVWRDTPIAPF